MNDEFLVKFLVVEEFANGIGARRFLDAGEFLLDVASFEIENAVRQIVESGALDPLAYPVHESRKLGDGSGDYEIVLITDIFDTRLFSGYIIETELMDAVDNDFDFLADRIDQVESAFGKENGEGDSWKSTSRADIHDAGSILEWHRFSDSERMQDVLFRKVLDVRSRSEIYFLVPFGNEAGVSGKALFLKIA